MENEIAKLNIRSERNYGIDLLRIIAMFFICIIHLIEWGGILEKVDKGTINYYLINMVNVVIVCAVNCYALISGYVGINSKFKPSNLAYLWIQTAFYLIILFTIFKIFDPSTVKFKWILKSFFPVTAGYYWYFIAYFGLFMFIPLLNFLVNNLSQKILCLSIISILITFTGLCFYQYIVFFSLNYGFSVLWLMILYLVGGYMARYKPLKSIKRITCMGILIILIIIMCITKFFSKNFSEKITDYISPTVLLFSIIMLEIFSRIKFKNKPSLIAFFSPLTFGVYLIHEHECVRQSFIMDKFVNYASFNPIFMALAVLGTALGIYVVCSLIDYLRLLLFKALKVKPTLEKLENKLKNKIFKEENNV